MDSKKKQAFSLIVLLLLLVTVSGTVLGKSHEESSYGAIKVLCYNNPGATPCVYKQCDQSCRSKKYAYGTCSPDRYCFCCT